MLTVKDIEATSGIYTIPKSIHVNKHVLIDFRLFRALTNPESGDYKYDFDVFLPKYNMNLQRPYVWEEVQQREFILSLLMEKELGSIVVVQHNNDLDREHTINYVIDGKQRLLTIKKFVNDEFPIVVNNKEYKFSDFSDELKRFFESRVNYMTAIVYYSYDSTPVTDDMKIVLFNFYNFSGTPQTQEHKDKLLSLMKDNGND